MPRLFEVTPGQIERLDARQLTELLRRLLYLEAARQGIARAAVQASLRIDVPDGGEDGTASGVWRGVGQSQIADRRMGLRRPG
jgi:hypothetical protein